MTPTNSNSISVRQMAKLLKKFGIRNGDILALKYQTPTANVEAIEAITNALGRMEMDKVLVIVVEDFSDLSLLNEADMNKHGWFRMKSLAKLVKIPEKEAKE